jgi:3,4-dihydroxy 2-butanone 4-phosphate synthase/GTP cyclohydrolase II
MTSWFGRQTAFLKDTLRGRPTVNRVATATIPTRFGKFTIHVYEIPSTGETHVALVRGEIGDGKNVLTRVHSSCVTGDIFYSGRCDCGAQLHTAMKRVADEDRGVILYLYQEGRGIGLANKIRAYALQENGFDTVEANEALGFKADVRDYRVGAHILIDLGVKSTRLLSNNPLKFMGVTGDGLSVSERLPLEIPASEWNGHYLRTKKEKLGHQLTLL